MILLRSHSIKSQLNQRFILVSQEVHVKKSGKRPKKNRAGGHPLHPRQSTQRIKASNYHFPPRTGHTS
ncbi:hypothetical protein BGP_2631 [Beggiatoa sp. PS]|nr:hypothetical protein BGP_2631 [Beggiatoa sp. PS]